MGTGNDETFNISSLRLIQYDVAEDLKYVPNISIPRVALINCALHRKYFFNVRRGIFSKLFLEKHVFGSIND